jgi:hypothetical protein
MGHTQGDGCSQMSMAIRIGLFQQRPTRTTLQIYGDSQLNTHESWMCDSSLK